MKPFYYCNVATQQFPFPLPIGPLDPSEILNVTDVSEQCLTDVNRFTSSLNTYVQTFTECQQAGGYTKQQQRVLDEHIFAVKQIDSFGKIPAGLLQYAIVNTGSYSECMDLVAPYKVQFCYLAANVAMEGPELGKLGPKIAVCMPKSCTETDITRILESTGIQQYIPINFTASANCVPLKNTYSTNFWIFICFVAFFVIWAILATFTDYILDTYYKGRVYGAGMKAFLAYSIYTNAAELMNVSPYKKGAIKSLASIRFISMTWVVAGHVLMDILVSDTLKPAMEVWNPVLSTTIINAFFSVDTFFVLSGILVSYLFFKIRPSAAYVRDPMGWVMHYVHRYIRLTPPVMIFIWFFVTVTPLINGPWAQSATGMQTTLYKPCEKYWWRNILYINNFFDLTQNCYIITWYLACDMQLYVIAPIFLIVFYISWIAGSVLVCLCIAGSIAYVYYISIHLDIPPIIVGAFAFDDIANFGLKVLDFFDLYYQKPWSRCTPYLIGFAVGYFLASGKKPKLNKVLIVSLWVLAAALALASLYGPHKFIKGEDDWSNAVSGTYNNFSRFGWSIAIAWVIVANHLGWGGIIADFMDHPLWQPLGRLSYCGYIVHFFMISYIFNLDDRPSHFVSIWRAYIYAGIPTVVVSYVFAFFWSCLFEVPIIKLEKMLTANVGPKKTPAPLKHATQKATKEDIFGAKNNVHK
ncbi:unnamed protein product [Cylicocyclus nassatus]|uniref:Nose resistant-to-fluoxetine protein N-terminal domain-containing protein n=1 Tax=Cylicocyclus nassatus TaxID=53992 RepID=A0AA36LZU6_CYLNA|nr:unnamed protein product [Cylicocyclus nassatus]